MLPADPISAAPGQPRRRHRKRPLIVRYWWAPPAIVLSAASLWVWSWVTQGRAPSRPLPGYIEDSAALRQEYFRFEGKALEDPGIVDSFEQAAALMREGSYSGAATVLEATAQSAPLPVVFNDLGVLYVKLNDGTQAVAAFRDALARDGNYQPVRSNLLRLKYGSAADPVTREVEPNGDNRQANVMALGKSVDAEISSAFNDLDSFRFTSPAAPRDLLAIELANRSGTLAPRLEVYESDGRLTDWNKESATPGASLRETVSPPPNTTFYVHVEGIAGTSGAYSLTVVPLKAFDPYEPNDEITRATPMALDRSIDANIMDENDTDYYSFSMPAGGEAAVAIRNRSTTLVPGVSTFGPDMLNSGFGPDLRTPGADLRHTLRGAPGATQYIQVWGKGRTAGAYSLTVK